MPQGVTSLDPHVFEKELESLEKRWEAVYGSAGKRTPKQAPPTENGSPVPSTARNLVGLAMSGGGIRSATINLGVVQALERFGVFKHFDYMSTVSGGGYLGASISNLMREPGREFPFQVTDCCDEPKYLTWIRNHSNYLVERGFIDYMRIFAILLRGIGLNFLVVLPWLLVGALLIAGVYGPLLLEWADTGFSWSAAENPVLGPAMRGFWTGWMNENWMIGAEQWLGTTRPFLLTPWVALLVISWFLLYPVIIRVFKAATHETSRATGNESSVTLRDKMELSFGWAVVIIAGFFLLEAFPYVVSWFHGLREWEGARGLLASVVSAASVVLMTSAGKLLEVFEKVGKPIVLAVVGLIGILLPLILLLYAVEFLIYDETPFEIRLWLLAVLPVLLLVGLVFAVYLRLKSLKARSGKEEQEPGRRKKDLLWFGRLLLVIVLVAVVVVLIGAVLPARSWFLLAFAVELWLFCGLAVDINLTSILGLNRDRLASAYLVRDPTAEEKAKRLARARDYGVDVAIDRDVNLGELCGGERKGSRAPYHLINVALNLQGSQDPGIRERNSDFFMFSKDAFGGPRTGYATTADLETVFPQMDLATAMAISAAFASPNMGTSTSAPLVALMTFFNIRFGYWVPNPRKLREWSSGKRQQTLANRFDWRVRPRAFLAEMWSRLHERGRWVNLSDGGHLENLAVIELLRRRCRLIICGDGEADPKLRFGGLATLIRYARLDMGIDIDLDPREIRQDRKTRTSTKHCALGKITYPKRDPADPNEPRETGWLLYVKSSYTGDEDPVIAEYRLRNTQFPHESTADAFFDEGQFEAYRSLGYHMAEGLFGDPNQPVGDFDDLIDRWIPELRTDFESLRRKPKPKAAPAPQGSHP